MTRYVTKDIWNYGDEIDMTLSEFIRWLLGEAQGFGDDPNVSIRYESGEDSSFDFELRRPETDEEAAQREATRQASLLIYKEREEASQRRQYEALKAKFG